MLLVTVEGAAAIVRVRDTGPGIAAEDLPHVFERLYRRINLPHARAADLR